MTPNVIKKAMVRKYIIIVLEFICYSEYLWTMLFQETILNCCYMNRRVKSHILILGDFHISMQTLSFQSSSVTIITDNFQTHRVNNEKTPLVSLPPTLVIFIAESIKTFEENFLIYKESPWWNYRADVFILEKTQKGCRNLDILNATWRMDSIKSIYICYHSISDVTLYTFNNITDYAPLPWLQKKKYYFPYVYYRSFNASKYKISENHMIQ